MVQSAWYVALQEENCVRVLELLRINPQLLKEGWNGEPKRVVEGYLSRKGYHSKTFSRHNGTKMGLWKGRTALHVGARRGSVDLVKEVIGMFDDEGKISWTNEQGTGVELSEPSCPAIFLSDLLAAKDGEYKLDALAMAVVNGNRDIIHILVQASILKCDTNPYEISSEWKEPVGAVTTVAEDGRTQLRKITEEVMENLTKSSSTDAEMLKELYIGSRDFNFLPWEEYLFHFTFSWRVMHKVERVDEVREGIFDRALSPSLRRFLCELQDGQGRTALHVAVDEGTVDQFLFLIPQERDSTDLLCAPDGVGRTPLHRAAAMNQSESLLRLVWDNRIDLNEKFCPWEYAESLRTVLGINLESLSTRNGFKGFGWFDVFDTSTAIHIAIIHKRIHCVRLLLYDPFNALNLQLPFTRLLKLRDGEGRRFALEPLQLAALVGDASILEMLLQEGRARDHGRPSTWSHSGVINSSLKPWPAIHLVAASGKFELLQLLMDSKNYDSFVEDVDGNTTLHHATKGKEVHFDTHLIDHISCQHAGESRLNERGQDEIRKEYVEREGCIELLLQAGFDIWKTNKAKRSPYPGPDATAKFLSCWYKKLTKETIALQNTLNAAANAISVTATLVATASYVGPLQPPLGLGSGDNSPAPYQNELQVGSFAVRVFIVCDTMSFYLAVAAIMLALIPSLPMPQESTIDELRRTRRMVTVAVGFLFPSIICVLLAFAAASIAVVPNSGSWNHGGLTMTTVFLGGCICFGVIILFSIRLLRLVFHKNASIRSLFKATYNV